VGRWVGPGLALVGLLPPLVSFTLSRKRLLLYASLISCVCFCIHINSTGTSENMSEAYVYVCIDVYFRPFWAYVGGINLSITTANSRSVVTTWPGSGRIMKLGKRTIWFAMDSARTPPTWCATVDKIWSAVYRGVYPR
jgi:hypothetical protein